MTIDEALGPYRGPCGFCKRPDARHRIWDAVKNDTRTMMGGYLIPNIVVDAIADVNLNPFVSASWSYALKSEAVEWIATQKRFPAVSRKTVKEWKANHGLA